MNAAGRRASRALLTIGVLLLAAPGLAEASGVRRLALLVGANDGGAGREMLRHAISDARAVEAVLTELGGVGPADAALLVQPTPAELSGALASIRARVAETRSEGQSTEVLFYYSGHSDADGLLLGDTSFSYRALREAFDAFSADLLVVVLDSCASGALIRSKGGVRRPSFVVPEPTAVRGHAYLTSSSADEAAQESDALGGSFFTHFLVSGLRGAADARGDGRVTLDDAYRFAARETLARTARTAVGSQHATYDIRLSGSGDIVLSDLHRASASLVLGAGFAGHLFVYDDRDRLSVELEKPEQREMEVGLAPGRYSVVLRRGADVLSGAVELHRGCTVLAPESLAPTALEPARTRGQGADPGPGPSAREPDAMKVASPAAGGDRPRWPLEISFGVTRIPILFFGYAPTDSLGVGVDWTFQRWGDLSLLGGGLGVVHVSPAMGASSTDWSSTPRTHAHLLAGPTLRYAPFERLYVEAGPVLTMHFNYFEDLPVSLGSGLRTGAGFVFWAGETQRWLIQASVESTFQMGRGNLFFQTFGLAWQR